MTYDYELTLIQQTYTEDEIGNQTPTEIKTVIYCGLKSIGRTEFYNAVAHELKPEVIFNINKFEYSGEQLIEFEGKKYKIICTYSNDFEKIELTCEKVI
ncbi:phage head-tail adapter protein [Clostridium beijerinckii]|nr:phage head-tail adapter protein [Clostridium beijerinckii]